MDHQKAKQLRQLRRRRHVRRAIVGTTERPRLTVFRSNKHIYAQLIDDLNGVTLAAASSSAGKKNGGPAYGGNVKAATDVGRALAEAAKAKGITKAAFDRGHYRFHGRVKALAIAANEAGLKCCESRKPPKEEAAAPAEKGKKAKPKGEKAPGKPAKAEKAKATSE